MKTTAIVLIMLGWAIFAGMSVAQESCGQTALDSIDAARMEHSEDIDALFIAIDSIEASYRECATMEPATEMSVDETAEEMSASEIIDGGHIAEGLWQFTLEYTLSDACEERTKTVNSELYGDVYYNDEGLLVWDAGNSYSNFVFEYLAALRYYQRILGNNLVDEYLITSATPTTMTGTYSVYWHGNRNAWCSGVGTFTAKYVEDENACLVDGEANIRTNPSTKSPANGKIDDQRRAIAKVSGDDGYYWWQLSEDEYVREDVVGSSRSCEQL